MQLFVLLFTQQFRDVIRGRLATLVALQHCCGSRSWPGSVAQPCAILTGGGMLSRTGRTAAAAEKIASAQTGNNPPLLLLLLSRHPFYPAQRSDSSCHHQGAPVVPRDHQQAAVPNAPDSR